MIFLLMHSFFLCTSKNINECNKLWGMNNEINLHTFRHTSVKLARESGADLHAISKRLGHSKINTTSDTYSELFENIDSELVDNLDEYIFKQLGTA